MCLQANDAITSPGRLIRDSEVKTASADWCALSGRRVHRDRSKTKASSALLRGSSWYWLPHHLSAEKPLKNAAQRWLDRSLLLHCCESGAVPLIIPRRPTSFRTYSLNYAHGLIGFWAIDLKNCRPGTSPSYSTNSLCFGAKWCSENLVTRPRASASNLQRRLFSIWADNYAYD